MDTISAPRIEVVAQDGGGYGVALSGRWTLEMLTRQMTELKPALAGHAALTNVAWNCLDIEAMDSAGAILLWRAWRRKLPAMLQARPEHLHIFERIDSADHQPAVSAISNSPHRIITAIGGSVLNLIHNLSDFIALIGQLSLDAAYLLRRPRDMPWREITANLYKSGVRAMPVTALVGFLIGIVLSYLSALQLKRFGADIFIVNILGLGIVRELGPVLVAVLVAGRSGSAMTAQLGVMRVTEEIDALATMGVSQSLRLIFPKVVALALAMPLLVLWATAMALLGGMVAAQIQLDLAYGFFYESLPRAVPVANLWIGLLKGFVFGVLVALVGCHFGLRVRPNTESLSANTTASVVTAITAVILVDAIIAIATRGLGLP
ncbi:MAG: ABC transporter permease [Betaproteobacteria bacterium]|nr:ABC transporter permease [Betaproteobacteria bacterium]